MNLFSVGILDKIDDICTQIRAMDVDGQVAILNIIRQKLHDAGPFADEPVDCVLWVKNDSVQANDYNPNKVAPPEMRLLRLSIESDGYTQPVVACPNNGHHEVVDGFHRTRVGKESPAVREKLHGYLPLTLIQETRSGRKDRMAATIRHNRARGVHGVVPMVAIVAELISRGWTDDEVAKELGMDADEVLRFKQNSGLPELFKNHEYSMAWE